MAVPVWFDDDGHRLVVASFAGNDRHPHWYLNLADKDANPEVRVRAQDHEFWADAEILDGSDYEAVWAQLVEDRAYYADYQTRTAAEAAPGPAGGASSRVTTPRTVRP